MKRILSLAVLVAFVASAPAHAEGKKKGEYHHEHGPVVVPGYDFHVDVPDSGEFHFKPHADVGNVPEPESLALVLAGLAVAGFVLHRRSQR